MGSYRAWEPNAIGSIVPPFAGSAASGGGGGGQTQDHQCPRFIVGNALAGDTAFVCDFLDPGDGTGITAALAAAAAVPGGAANVCVRPGIYTIALSELPFVVPSRTTIYGAGPSTELRNPTTQRRMFTVAASAVLRAMALRVDPAPVGSAGLEVVSLDSDAVFFESSINVPGITVNESLTAFVRTVGASSRARVESCTLIGASLAMANVVLDGTEHSVEDVVVDGIATGAVRFVQASNRCVVDNVRGRCTIGFVVEGDRHVMDGDFQCDGTGIGVDVIDANRCRICATATLAGGPTVGSFGLRVRAGSRNTLNGCIVEAFETGAAVLGPASRTLLLGNQLDATTTPLSDAGTLTEAAHNQL